MPLDASNPEAGHPAMRGEGETPAATPPRTRLGRFSGVRRTKREAFFSHSAGEVALAAFMLAAIFAAFFLFPGHFLPVIGLVTALVGVGKLVVTHAGAGGDDELPPASAAFRALADPARPLGPDDPVTRLPGSGDSSADPERDPPNPR